MTRMTKAGRRRRVRLPWPQARDSVDRILADWARERPDLDFSSVAVVTRLARVRSHLDAGLARVFTAHGLSSADFQVVVTLRRVGPPYQLPQARLMTELALTSGTVSVRVDRLSSAGVVVRTPDPDDRRGALVRLTGHGLELFDRVAPEHLANEDRLLSALTPAERDTLAGLLRRLLVSFESAGSQVAGPLGVTLEPAHVARQRRQAVGLSDTAGLLVSDLVAGSAAAAAGIARGDLLVAAAGTPLTSQAALADLLGEVLSASRRPTSVPLTVLRGNDRLELTITVPHPPTTTSPSTTSPTTTAQERTA
jgi:DNA-binding MarR family transcriptional regulator